MIGCQSEEKKRLQDNTQVSYDTAVHRDRKIMRLWWNNVYLKQVEVPERQVNGTEGHRIRVD